MPRCPRVSTPLAGCPSVRPKHRSSSCTRTSVPDLQDIRGRVGQHVGRPGLGRHRAHRVLPAVVPRPAAWQRQLAARANAAGCAQDAGAFAAYHDTVFANQPEREGDGYTDEELLQFGRDAGIEGMPTRRSRPACRTARTRAGVQQVQQGANDRPVTGTPTLFLDGEPVDTSELITGESFDPEKLRADRGAS